NDLAIFVRGHADIHAGLVAVVPVELDEDIAMVTQPAMRHLDGAQPVRWRDPRVVSAGVLDGLEGHMERDGVVAGGPTSAQHVDEVAVPEQGRMSVASTTVVHHDKANVSTVMTVKSCRDGIQHHGIALVVDDDD